MSSLQRSCLQIEFPSPGLSNIFCVSNKRRPGPACRNSLQAIRNDCQDRSWPTIESSIEKSRASHGHNDNSGDLACARRWVNPWPVRGNRCARRTTTPRRGASEPSEVRCSRRSYHRWSESQVAWRRRLAQPRSFDQLTQFRTYSANLPYHPLISIFIGFAILRRKGG